MMLAALPLSARTGDDAARKCIGGLSNDYHFSISTFVFLGRAIDQIRVPLPDGWANTQTTFAVEQQWKGERQQEVVVQTCGDGISTHCSTAFSFERGTRYLVFAHGNPPSTSRCSLTGTAEQSAPVIAWLDQRGK
ncbi:MAG: hypothetical protein IT178_10090 [Acidobacteria bacterium]|nr:hypothetical protein [Acidobacteriota bacterium]